MCYGGVLMLGRTVFYGGALCVMAVYCMLWSCTVCYGGVFLVQNYVSRCNNQIYLAVY